MTGASLMDDGLDLFAAESTGAHLLTFTRVTAEEAARSAPDASRRRGRHSCRARAVNVPGDWGEAPCSRLAGPVLGFSVRDLVDSNHPH